MSALLLAIKNGTVRYSGKTVFEDLSFNIHAGRKIALVGKNGAGKTTLMRMITAERELDDGERWIENNISVGYLTQDITPKKGQSVCEYIMEEIEAEYKEAHQYKVDIVTKKLGLDPDTDMTRLSGGQLRRAGLARVLVEESDILLMDEPTNHLDLEAIEWLEQYLKNYPGTLLVVSHDRTFLSNVTDCVFWLDRGAIKVSPNGFSDFEDWSEMLLDQEARELKNRKSALALEVEWASRGVKARRKRNLKRVEQMHEMREKLKRDESAYRRATANIKINDIGDLDHSSKVVCEFYNVTKSFVDDDNRDIPILNKFNIRIKKGDRIGILGKNGSGKTSFLKMLTGEILPDSGRIKMSKTVEISYFDQKRSDLRNDWSIRRTLCPQGGDYIDVHGKQRHVCGYIKDFMFDPQDVDKNVGILSGGEKNRLLLAKILAKPGNFLILDEPTNDLDMDTLDRLEDILSHYSGTLIVVSHDRDFLDQTISQVLAFEGDTKVERHIGGYSHYLETLKNQEKQQRGLRETKKPAFKNDKKEGTGKNEKKLENLSVQPQKLSYKLKYEYEQLPDKILDTEDKIKLLNAQLADVEFYQRDPEAFHSATRKLTELQTKLERYEIRWLELDEMQSDTINN